MTVNGEDAQLESAELSEEEEFGDFELAAFNEELQVKSIDEEKSEEVYEKMDDYYSILNWRNVYYERDSADEKDAGHKHGLNKEQKIAIIHLHNELRLKEGAANMHKLHWNEKLAELGQKWSEKCVFEHGQPPHDIAKVGYKEIGQNIFAHTSPKFHVNDAVHAWYDEKADYNYDSLTCKAGKVCGHYTAVTWGNTKEVGCGMAFCPSISGLTKAHFIVCNYGPSGNWGGEKPFIKGAACTKCGSGKGFCDKGLCDSKCKKEGPHCKCEAVCHNGGTLKDCSCHCKEGFMGTDCEDHCKDLSPQCGANPGYPEAFCKSADPDWAFVKDKCPKMCGKCKAKRENEPKSEDVANDDNSLKRLLNLLEDELVNHEFRKKK